MAKKTSKAELDKLSSTLNGMIKHKVIRVTWKRLVILLSIVTVLLALFFGAGYFLYKHQEKKMEVLTKIQVSLTDSIYSKSSRTPYRTCNKIVLSAMGTDHPLFILALASRSGYQQSWFGSNRATGLCAIPIGFVDDLVSAGIILQAKDLFHYENNIKSAGFVWGIIWKRSNGNINTALSEYFFKDDPGAVKVVMDNYWEFIYLIRRPVENEK